MSLHLLVLPAVVVDGHPDAGSMLHLCASVFSWMVGEHAAKSGGDIYLLQACLLRYAQAAGSELDARPRANARTILRERGLSRESVRARWREVRAEHGYQATLDLELLSELFPLPVWRALARLIADGPAVCSERIDRVLHQVASRPAAAHAGGGEGARVSRRSIENYAWPLSWTMRTLVDLLPARLPVRGARAWQHAPVVRVPSAPSANTDRSAPPWRLVRLAWQQVDRDVKRRLGADSTAEELEIVQDVLGASPAEQGRVVADAVARAVRADLPLGGRSGAVCELRRADLRPRPPWP